MLDKVRQLQEKILRNVRKPTVSVVCGHCVVLFCIVYLCCVGRYASAISEMTIHSACGGAVQILSDQGSTQTQVGICCSAKTLSNHFFLLDYYFL